jgi:glycosyltransferase involved in cell wall biosynthesis
LPVSIVRILQIIDALGPGGKERQFVELLKGLRRKSDIECLVVIMSDLIRYDAFRELGIRTEILSRRTRYDPGIFRRLYALAKPFKPDIIHSWDKMCSVYAAPVAMGLGAKFVNGIIRDARPRTSLFEKQRLLTWMTLPFSDVVVGNSQAGLAVYGVPAARSACVYNGFDQKRVAAPQREQDVRAALDITTPFVVGMVAAFDRHKDYDTFFAMAKRIGERRSDVTFVAVGEGSRLARYKEELASYPHIRLLGRRGDVESIVNIFTVGVLTSVGEGIANAIMEYMALGKPVVATRAGGNPELVEEGRTGYLVADKDVDALTEHVLGFLDDPQKAQEFGARGRARIQMEFSLQKMTDEYIALYRTLIGA